MHVVYFHVFCLLLSVGCVGLIGVWCWLSLLAVNCLLRVFLGLLCLRCCSLCVLIVCFGVVWRLGRDVRCAFCVLVVCCLIVGVCLCLV